MSSTTKVSPPSDCIKSIELANNSYFEANDFNSKNAAAGINLNSVQYIVNDEFDTQCYAGVDVKDRIVYVAFRGTSSAKDALIDADEKWHSANYFGPNVNIHDGFHTQYHAVANELNAYLDAHESEYDTVFFTGHSLGGGLATTAVAYYFLKHKDDDAALKKTVKVHTYGCPRVGNKNFNEYYQKSVEVHNHWRFFNEHDPVPKVPPHMSIIDGYIHVNGNSVMLYDDIQKGYEIMQVDNIESFDLKDKVDEHHTSLYQSNLQYILNLFHHNASGESADGKESTTQSSEPPVVNIPSSDNKEKDCIVGVTNCTVC